MVFSTQYEYWVVYFAYLFLTLQKMNFFNRWRNDSHVCIPPKLSFFNLKP